jgi:hypothetical protein
VSGTAYQRARCGRRCQRWLMRQTDGQPSGTHDRTIAGVGR